MNIVVLKFGGTSVADNEKLNIVTDKIISLHNEGYSVVAVVSAQGKRTDMLLNEAYEITKNPNARELDVLLSTGEQESIAKLGILLNEKGYKSVSLTGWQAGIYTNDTNQNAIIEHINTDRIHKELEENKIVIVAGFQGLNKKLDITTLGRGGSDSTAVALAAALNAKCFIYSDVEGVYTCDPKKLENPSKLDNISYDEVLDVANEGAKVLHNRCIEIAKKYDIPIVARSTFSNDVGTNIDNKIEVQKVKSLVKNDELLVVQLLNIDIDFLSLYNTFIANDIMPIEFSNTNYGYVALIKNSDKKKLEYIFENNPKIICKDLYNISRISIIGYGIANDTKITKEILKNVSDLHNKIQNIDINNGKIRITFKEVISNDILEKLHQSLIQ